MADEIGAAESERLDGESDKDRERLLGADVTLRNIIRVTRIAGRIILTGWLMKLELPVQVWDCSMAIKSTWRIW